MTSQIIHLQETSSTNTYAKNSVVQGAKHGTIIWAKNQTAGRGRLGKSWQSNKGDGLYCSIIYYPKCLRQEYSKITLISGLAVAEVIEQIVKQPVMLKWPNDIYIADKKCGGILCEAVLSSAKDAVIIGIGVNVSHKQTDFTRDIIDKATSLKILGMSVSVESLLEKVYQRVMMHIDSFCDGEWLTLLQLWKQRDFLAGKQSEWLLHNGQVKVGRAEGVDANGLLHIVTEDGVRHQVLSGDVQLKGQIVSKISAKKI